ncbi:MULTISPECIES: hypothetical protein [Lysinibacillus]|uniref:DUF4183 domain-containing protein n=1 Tax=Lysinibacillus xylanilyticus TaxID=582475 RepID=A0ABV3VSK9_9BACI
MTEFDQKIVPLTVIELTSLPKLLTNVTLNNNNTDDRVWLTGTVQTIVGSLNPLPGFIRISLQIFRNDPTFTTTPIFRINDSVVDSGFANDNTTTFTFVDLSPPTGLNIYYLTGHILSQDPQSTQAFIEKIVFTGAEIKANS